MEDVHFLRQRCVIWTNFNSPQKEGIKPQFVASCIAPRIPFVPGRFHRRGKHSCLRGRWRVRTKRAVFSLHLEFEPLYRTSPLEMRAVIMQSPVLHRAGQDSNTVVLCLIEFETNVAPIGHTHPFYTWDKRSGFNRGYYGTRRIGRVGEPWSTYQNE